MHECRKPKTNWVAYTLDEVVGTGETKADLLVNLHGRVAGKLVVRKVEPGLYEYKSYGETRTRTFWVATKAKAKADGVQI